MSIYSLRKFLRNVPNSLLKDFFEKRAILADCSWNKKDDSNNDIPINETEIAELEEAIVKLNQNDLLKVQQEFKDIYSLAKPEIISCMIELAKRNRYMVNLADEFEENQMTGPLDRAMWVYIHHNQLFNYTLKFQEAIHTAGSRDFYLGNSLFCNNSEDAVSSFKKAVIKHYKSKGRGDKCVIDHYYRNNPTESHCYYIFHEDGVKSVTVLNDDGTDLIRNPRKDLFENVIFFEPQTGMLRIHALGEKNCQSLADLFCIHILGLEFGRPDTETRIYDLSKAKDLKFKFESESSIEKVHIKEIVFEFGSREQISLKTSGREGMDLILQTRFIDLVKAYGLDVYDPTVRILKIKLQFVFKKLQGQRQITRIVEVAVPNRTGFSDDSYGEIIRLHIDNIWGFKRKLFTAPQPQEAA